MIILLRDAGTGRYYRGGVEWSAETAGAVEFGTLRAAGDGARGCGCDDVEVVLRYADPACELALNPAYCV